MKKIKLTLVVALLSGAQSFAASDADVDSALASYGTAANLLLIVIWVAADIIIRNKGYTVFEFRPLTVSEIDCFKNYGR